jgi:DNA-binding HxlR family transcriptional regulator
MNHLTNGDNKNLKNQSGSLCPAVKAADMIGDKWTLLILREMIMGGSRYSDFQKAIPRISPTVLSKRLKELEANDLIIKKSSPSEKTREYRLTRSGRELRPIIHYMSKWGLRWARRRLKEEDLDVGAFMWDFHRTLAVDELPDGESVLSISFTDQDKLKKWWVVSGNGVVELCTQDPGKEVDLFLTSSLPALAEVWMGDVDIRSAVKCGDVVMSGASYLIRTASQWFPKSTYANVRPEHIRD